MQRMQSANVDICQKEKTKETCWSGVCAVLACGECKDALVAYAIDTVYVLYGVTVLPQRVYRTRSGGVVVAIR